MPDTEQVRSLIATLQSEFGPEWRQSLVEPRPNDPIWREDIGIAAGVSPSDWRYGLDKINQILTGDDYRRVITTLLPESANAPIIIRPSHDQITLPKQDFFAPAPNLSRPICSTTLGLIAAPLTPAAPVLQANANPIVYTLLASKLTNITPAFGPILVKQLYMLTEADLLPAVPTFGTANLKQVYNLTAANLTSDVPVLDLTDLSQYNNLWTPASLGVVPKAIVDGTTINWSGSSFSSTPNAGTLGGSIEATATIPTKGSPQLNGFDVIDFSPGKALGIALRSWPAATNVSIFAVYKPLHDSVPRGLVSLGFYSPTAGWVFYSSMAASTWNGHTINANDMWILGSGANDTQDGMIAAPPAAGWAITFAKVGSQNLLRTNGSVITPSYAATGTNAAVTNQMLNIGAGNAIAPTVSDLFEGQIAYLAILVDPSADDILRLEGWAAWKYGLQSLLPGGHTYKTVPPTTILALGITAKVPTIGTPALVQISAGSNLSNAVPILGAPAFVAGGTWTPAQLTTAPRYIFDPSTLTYSGSNFSSGNNGGSAGGAWTIEVGTLAKTANLNGHEVVNFTGTQGIINAGAAWPTGNVYVFAVIEVDTTHIGVLASHSWGATDGRDTTHGWVCYPRAGNGFGGSVNEAWMFQGITAALMTRGDLLTDTSFHLAGIKIGAATDLRKDGTAGTPSIITGTVTASLTSNFRIGANSAAADEALTGKIAYLAVMSNPTTLEVQKMEGWAAWRFGLQGQLPVGHPYKSAAP